MTFVWGKRDSRYAPYHMVWPEHNYNEPRFETAKLHLARSLRYWPRLDWIEHGSLLRVNAERRYRLAEHKYPFPRMMKPRKRKTRTDHARSKRR